MAKTTKALTNTEVKQARAKAKEYNLADGKGLYLRVKPNGTKLWIFQYPRPFTKKRSNLSLGTFPPLSLADAREEVAVLRAALGKGIDPKVYRDQEDKRRAEAHGATFETVFRRWLQVKEPSISESYRQRMVAALELHVLPRMGKVPVSELTAPMAIEYLSPIAARGALETVRKLCRWINEVMDYAVNAGMVQASPLSGIRKAFQTPATKNRPAIESEELPAFLQALEQASITLPTRCAIEWLIYTLARPAEGATAKWSEIDFEVATWTIPAEKMKMRRPHVVPLSRQALAILQVIKPLSGHREYIFPSAKNPREGINPSTANMAIKRMGYGGRLVAHGIRALGSTILNEQGHDPDLIEVTLAHVDKNAIRAAYNRAEYLERRRKLMEWWGEYIEAAATGRELGKGKKHLRIA
ncbi:MAG: integrase domain-containing protein [Pseudomonadales bacterium]|nr:integrase domain-containing protein [Pseudomonadales bacterium]